MVSYNFLIVKSYDDIHLLGKMSKTFKR